MNISILVPEKKTSNSSFFLINYCSVDPTKPADPFEQIQPWLQQYKLTISRFRYAPQPTLGLFQVLSQHWRLPPCSWRHLSRSFSLSLMGLSQRWCIPWAGAQRGSEAMWQAQFHPTPPTQLLWHPLPCSANCWAHPLQGSQTEILISLLCSVSLLLLCHLHLWEPPAVSVARGKSLTCWAAGMAGRKAPPAFGHPPREGLSRWEFHPPPGHLISKIFLLG